MVKSKCVTISHAAEMKAVYQVSDVRSMALLHMFLEYCKNKIYSYADKDFNANKQMDNRRENWPTEKVVSPR